MMTKKVDGARFVDLVDPPGGGAFGFPTPLGDWDAADIGGWLVANGYPEEWVRLYPEGVPCRIVSCPAGELWRFGIEAKTQA